MTATKTSPFVLRAADIAARAERHAHPWDPSSLRVGAMLGRALGLKRTGVHVATIPPGEESFVDHAHGAEEQWLYILSGRGVARIGGEELELGPTHVDDVTEGT